MFSNRGGEIIWLEWLEGITPGSDITKDLRLPCFSFCNFRLYNVKYYISIQNQMFADILQKGVPKNFAIFRPATLLRRGSNIGIFL